MGLLSLGNQHRRDQIEDGLPDRPGARGISPAQPRGSSSNSRIPPVVQQSFEFVSSIRSSAAWAITSNSFERRLPSNLHQQEILP